MSQPTSPYVPRLLAVVPAYNEEASIPGTAAMLRDAMANAEGISLDCLVVNDGSSDATAARCRDCGLPVVSLPINTGITGAVQTGLKYADRNGYDFAVQVDADGQHDPRYLTALVEFALATRADIVIGSRFVDAPKDWSARMIGSRLITGAIKITTGKTIHDPTSGFRLFSRAMIEMFAEDGNFSPEPDTLAFALRKGAKVVEVPVEMRERSAGESYLNPWSSAQYMVKMAVSIFLLQWVRKE